VLTHGTVLPFTQICCVRKRFGVDFGQPERPAMTTYKDLSKCYNVLKSAEIRTYSNPAARPVSLLRPPPLSFDRDRRRVRESCAVASAIQVGAGWWLPCVSPRRTLGGCRPATSCVGPLPQVWLKGAKRTLCRLEGVVVAQRSYLRDCHGAPLAPARGWDTQVEWYRTPWLAPLQLQHRRL
jgi:hypothetical protein